MAKSVASAHPHLGVYRELNDLRLVDQLHGTAREPWHEMA
jgi:hypothetical protein